MKGVIIVVVVLVLGYGAIQWMNALKAKSDFAARVERQLDFVDGDTMDAVKQDIVQEAQKFGITLTPDNIGITSEDTQQRSIAQQIVGNKLGAQFANKHITIKVHYTTRILGIPLGQDITTSKNRQVEAPRMPQRSEERQLVDPTGATALPGVE